MRGSRGAIALAAVAAFSVAAAEGGAAAWEAGNQYVVTNLVSNLTGVAKVTDRHLKNAWGVAFSPAGSPFWVNANGTGRSTLYDGEGTIVPLVVRIPGATGSLAAPTGIVFNPTSGFPVPGTTTPAAFLFATEDGTISAWATGLSPRPRVARLAVDQSSFGSGAVFKGLAYGVNVHGAFIFATDFRNARIAVFDKNFAPATLDGDFTDPNMPTGYAPFGIENIDGDLFVSYAVQDAEKHDDVAGPGQGFVDIYDTDGHFLRRFASGRPLNSPWGMARASFAFGPFSGEILIGNFGNGRVDVFDSQGDFLDRLRTSGGRALKIDGLWKLTLGGGAKSSSDTLFFTAGPNGESDGLFGTITPAAQGQ